MTGYSERVNTVYALSKRSHLSNDLTIFWSLRNASDFKNNITEKKLANHSGSFLHCSSDCYAISEKYSHEH